MTNPYNADVRRVRRQAQLAHLDTILARPERAQAGALFARWPERLPRVVRSKIPTIVLALWRSMRAQAVEDRNRYDLQQQEMMEGLEHEMLDKHGKQARAIARVAASLSQLKKIVVALNSDLSTEFGLEDDCENEIILAFCMALEAGGGITLRQTLTLRSQVKNDRGELEWRAQERLYGIHCLDGQWQGLTVAQIRHAYQFDEDGNKLETDPITSFGDAAELIRRLK